jgi:hypothetical protein
MKIKNLKPATLNNDAIKEKPRPPHIAFEHGKNPW